jgi:hypothetical protein
MEAFDQREPTRTNHKSRSGNPEFEMRLPLIGARFPENLRKRRLKGGRRLESPSPHANTTVELQDRLGAQWGVVAAV